MALTRPAAHDWARWSRQRAKARTGRTETVRALIERIVSETGRAPTDEALARLLACSVDRVAHHRRLLRM